GMSEAQLSADGKALVTFGRGTLAVWDVATGRRTYYSRDLDFLNTIESGTVAVGPDGSWRAYLSRSKAAVRVVELATGKERLAVGALGKVPGGPANVAQQANVVVFRSVWVPADGKTILLCDDQTLYEYDAVS